MSIDSPVYIRFSWIAVILSVLVYLIIGRHFPGDDRQVLCNGATWYDLIAFNGLRTFMFLLSLSFSTLMIYVTDRIHVPMLNRLKYFVFFITSVLFIRMCFHFVFYEKIVNFELVLYGLSAIAILSRFIYTTRKWQQDQ